jgi:hypothetical protein
MIAAREEDKAGEEDEHGNRPSDQAAPKYEAPRPHLKAFDQILPFGFGISDLDFHSLECKRR